MLVHQTTLLGSQTSDPGLFLLVIGFVCYFFVYPFFLHPLRKIPHAHWTIPFPYLGSIWILWQRYSKNNNAITWKAHREHGEVVRLAYNELSVRCVRNGIRTIYGGGWDKHDWYPRNFASYGVINMFGSVHHGPHSQKKRTLAHTYSKSNIQSSVQLKSNSKFLLTHRLFPLLQSFSDSGEAVDVHDLNNASTMDFISAYLYGIRHSTNLIGDLEQRRDIMGHYHQRHDGGWYNGEIPLWLRRWAEALHVPLIPNEYKEGSSYLEKWNSNMCEFAEKYLIQQNDNMGHPGDEPLVYKQFKTGLAKLRSKDPEAGRESLPHIVDLRRFRSMSNGLEELSRREVYSEMYDHILAGHETSAVALTYLFWEMSRNPSMQDRLHDDVLQLSPPLA